MHKFYRSVLLTGLVAVGLAGCGDDVTVVQPPPPPPPPAPTVKSISVAPNPGTVAIGGTITMSAAVVADEGVATTVTWSSSDASKATVNATSGVVTGVSTGSVAITATSTVAPTVSGNATVNVTAAPALATISISSVNTAGGAPVLLAAVAGQINVVLNLDRGGETVTGIDLLLCGKIVGSQNFAAPMAADGDVQAAVEQITIPVNTAAFDPITGEVLYCLNGPTTLSAVVRTAQNAQGTASPSVNLTLANVNVVNLTTSVSGASATNPATGILWSTGDLTVTAIPVVYTSASPTIQQVAISATGLNTKTITTAPFTATWAKATSVANGGSAATEGPITITATSVINGVSGPAGPAPAPVVQLDNLGPAAPTVAAMSLWVNGAFAFTAGATAATGVIVGVDGGVGGVTAAFFVGAVTALPGSPTATSCSTTGLTAITAANETALPGTIVSTVYRGRVVTSDLLGNQTCAPLSPGGVSAGPFGADYIAPTGSVTGPADGSAAAATGAAFAFTVADNASGFGATPLSGIITRLNANNTTSCVFGSGTGCTVPGTSVLTLDAYNSSTTDGYYTFNPIIVSDQAANQLAFTGRTYLLDQVPAAFSGGLSLQALYVGGATAVFTTQATDNLDLNNVFGTLTYPTGTFQFPAQTIGTFGAPLLQSAAVNFSIPNFMRCVNVANDFATTTNQANSVDLFLSDFAQAAPTAFGATAIPGANVQACGAVGNVTGMISFNQNAPVFPTGKNQVDINGSGLAANSSVDVTLSAVADVPLNTSVDPFARVDFYYQNTAGNWVQVGQGVATLSQTPTQRLWTYTFLWNPDSAVQAGAVNVVAVGVDSNGDAVFTGAPQVVNTVP